MNLNKVFLIGNLTRDAELKTLPSGSAVATFGLATNRTYTDKTGQKQTETEFHSLVLWGKRAEVLTQYLTKGKMIFVEGRLKTTSWTSPAGEKKNRIEIFVEDLQLGPKSTYGPSKGAEGEVGKEDLATVSIDDIPQSADNALMDKNSEDDFLENIPF